MFKISKVSLLLLNIFLFSCSYSREDAKKYLPGEYYFKTAFDEYEVLKINPDFTFTQTIHSKKNNSILYKNKGKMFVNGNKIEFKKWFVYFQTIEPTEKEPIPYFANSFGIYWRKPKGNTNVLIIMYDESKYIFEKQK